MANRLLAVVIVAGAVLAAATLQPGLDYFIDPSASIDALARGDWSDFFANQPLMGSLSLLLRAPFVRLVFHSGIDGVYFVGVVPCVLALVTLVLALLRRMERAGRTVGERVAVAVICLGSPIMVKAIHWGHPEELLGTALCVGAVLAAAARRSLLAGLLLGAALGTKQWAVLAVLPVLLALPEQRGRFLVSAAITAGILTVPMLLGDPDRFLTVLRAAGSVDPQSVLGTRTGPVPGAHVTPYNLLWPFAHPETVNGARLYFVDAIVARPAHALILLAGALAGWRLWRRAPVVGGLAALQLLALVFALRGVLDPMSLDYYHLPLAAALGAAAAIGGRRETRVALLATAGLALVFAEPAISAGEIQQHAALKCIGYLAVMLALIGWLGRELYGPAPALARINLVGDERKATPSARRAGVHGQRRTADGGHLRA